MSDNFLVRIVNLVTYALVSLLLGRLLLKFLGASVYAPFVSWIYDSTYPFLLPFRGMFPDYILPQGNTIETSSFAAAIVYMVAGYLLAEFVEILVSKIPHRSPMGKPKKKDSNDENDKDIKA